MGCGNTLEFLPDLRRRKGRKNVKECVGGVAREQEGSLYFDEDVRKRGNKKKKIKDRPICYLSNRCLIVICRSLNIKILNVSL